MMNQNAPKQFTYNINQVPVLFLARAAKKLHIRYIIHDGRIIGWEDDV